MHQLRSRSGAARSARETEAEKAHSGGKRKGTHRTQFMKMSGYGIGFSAPRLALRRAARTCCGRRGA
jgi:hypothetical protein